MTRSIKTLLKRMLLSLFSLLLTLLFLEGLMRVHKATTGDSRPQKRKKVRSETLGWVYNTGADTLERKTFTGRTVRYIPTGNPLLNKLPASPAASLRLLFLGDSYTEADNISTGEAYFDVFEQLTAS